MDYPVFETLFGIFAFGLVITGIVFNGIYRARGIAQRIDAVQRAHRTEAASQSLESGDPAGKTAPQMTPTN